MALHHVALLLGALSTIVTPPGVISATTSNNGLVLLNVIKKSLRRNNDDYELDITPSESNTTGAPTVTLTSTVTTALMATDDTDVVSVATVTSTETSAKVFKKKSLNYKLLKAAASSGRTSPSVHRSDKKQLIRKNIWKRILKKSKNLRLNTSNSSQSTVSSHMVVLRNAAVGRTARLQSLFPARLPGYQLASPNAEQLDMAPARGAYIQNLRDKNRFCHRNVLWPEGPKYDKDGNTMLPIYNPKMYGGKDFSQTRKPPLVLPLCCNCCKKSVLGCQ